MHESTPRHEDVKPSVAASEAAPARPWYASLHRNPWVIAFLVGAVTLLAIRPFLRHEPEPPAIDFALPQWQLVDHTGATFGSEQLAGEVWVASFFFTSCPSICPRLMASMLELQDRFEKAGVDVKLVAFSVDPENDTPAVLREYGEKLGADLDDRWTFVTGTDEAVRALIIDGFKLHVGDKTKNDAGLIDIAHYGRFVLVDWQGNVRGRYDTDDSGVDEVFHRAQHVLRARDDAD